MRPLRLLSWSSVALAAALAHNIGGAAAVEPPAKSAVPVAAGNTPSATPKIMHTIPEDGMGDTGIPASSRLVRHLLGVHPNEDLVICIAGCRPGADRVVHAVPADPLPPAIAVTRPAAVVQPAAATEPEPATAAAPVAATPAVAPAATPAPSAKADEVKPAAEAPESAANAAAPAEPNPVAKPESAEAGTKKMVPTAAEKDEVPASKGNNADDAEEEASSDKKSSDESDEEERSDNDEGESNSKD